MLSHSSSTLERKNWMTLYFSFIGSSSSNRTLYLACWKSKQVIFHLYGSMRLGLEYAGDNLTSSGVCAKSSNDTKHCSPAVKAFRFICHNRIGVNWIVFDNSCWSFVCVNVLFTVFGSLHNSSVWWFTCWRGRYDSGRRYVFRTVSLIDLISGGCHFCMPHLYHSVDLPSLQQVQLVI